MGPELAFTMQQQNLRAELSCFCETISSGLGRGQKKQIECEELLGWEQGKEVISCPMQVPGVPASQTWHIASGQHSKRCLCNWWLCRCFDLKSSLNISLSVVRTVEKIREQAYVVFSGAHSMGHPEKPSVAVLEQTRGRTSSV